MTDFKAHAAMLKNAVRLLGAALIACAPSLVTAFPYPVAATVDIFPWAPTPVDHVFLLVADTYGQTSSSAGGYPVSSKVSSGGNVITVTVTWSATPVMGGLPSSCNFYCTFQVDLGVLPIGQYTVNYLHVPNLPYPPLSGSVGFTVSATGYATAVEYFAPSLGHYFITSDANEIAALDSAAIPGWARTGEGFHVIPAAVQPTSTPSVCRFYGLPQAGLNSHFFTSSPSECQAVQQLWPNAWILESPDAFAVAQGPLGAALAVDDCPAGSVSLYRLYNNRRDANHRLTTSPAIRDQMIAQGWLLEGDQGGAAMCVPQ